MEYLKLENLKYFIKEADQKYVVDGPGVAFFKDTKEKLGYLINLIGSELQLPFVINYEERPNKQPGRSRPPTLKNYILLGFIPEKYQDTLGKKVFVKIELDVKNRLPRFFIELDTNLKLSGNELNDIREELNKATHWEIPIDGHFPINWVQLSNTCLPYIKKCLVYLDGLAEKKLNQKNPILNNNLVIMDSVKKTSPLNQVLYGPPGTGKTYNTINKALEILGQKFESEDRATIKRHFDEKVKEGQIMFTTFHQSMSYEDFIEGIKPIKPSSDDEFLKYDIEDGIFKKLCLQAGMKQQTNFRAAYDQFITQTAQQGNELVEMKTPSQKIFHVNVNSNDNLSLFTGSDKTKQGVLTAEKLEEYALGYTVFKGWQGYASGVLEYLRLNFNLQVVEQVEDKKYVLIIDEINRGNVSSIFGELITLIEEDKRQGKPEALEVILPYSKDKFSVPQNLYIIGTMNTADRSVEALDAALRRRFSFIEMPPRYDLGELKYEYEGIIVSDILRTINTRIEKLLDKDHKIGHSYFILGKNETAEGKLLNSFYNSIIPLLQEYFYGDYGKIGLVLGMGFVIKKGWNSDLDKFAKFEAYDHSDFDGRDVFGLVDYRDFNATQEISNNGYPFIKDFKNAIYNLMNKSLD